MPIKTSDDFVLNENFHQLVLASKLPRSSKFVDQSISFCKAFCKSLMSCDIVKSNFLRRLSAFDSPVVLESPEDVYTTAIEKLSSHFVSVGIFTSNDRMLVVSQYRSFVTKLRSDPVPEYDDWIQFVVTHYEIQCRPALLRLFRLSCLSLAPVVDMPPTFDVPVPDLNSDKSCFSHV